MIMIRKKACISNNIMDKFIGTILGYIFRAQYTKQCLVRKNMQTCVTISEDFLLSHTINFAFLEIEFYF